MGEVCPFWGATPLLYYILLFTMKRLLLSTLYICLNALYIYSVPACPLQWEIVQKDYSKLRVSLIGDEHCHFFVTHDGMPIGSAEDGSYYYLTIKGEHLVLSDVLAHEQLLRDADEKKYVQEYVCKVKDDLASIWNKRLVSQNYRRSRRRSLTSPEENSAMYQGHKKGLVILVNFSNLEMSFPDANERFSRMFNSVGYSENNAVGSVHDYFYDQSYGAFNLTFDVIGPVTVSNSYGYYGANNVNGSDKRPNEMVVEACKLVDKDVNFADYDWDGDGQVDQVFIVYAGYGESNGAPGNTIWPHESQLSYREDSPLILDNVTIDTYACTCELIGTSGTRQCGIGTACHEFSHCLGLPDFYDTGYNGGFGMNCWDLMSSGSHCGPTGNGEVPTGYTAYERHFLGWLDYVELSEPSVVTGMQSIAEAPVAYVVYNDGNRDEYFLLENRQCQKWFSYVKTYTGSHGLLISHVDYDEAAWNRNHVNTSAKHQRMTIVPADMSYGKSYTSEGKTYFSVDEQELKGDLFPGLLNITEMTDASHYASGGKLFNLNADGSYYLNKPITNIKESDGLVSFYFMGGIYVPIPELLPVSDVNDHSFTVHWTPVASATHYDIELSEGITQEPPDRTIIISESLYRFKTDNDTPDGFSDLGETLDSYMQNAGWTGRKIFTSQYGLKLGTTSIDGILISPAMTSSNGNLTVRFSGRSLSSNGTRVQFSILNMANQEIMHRECDLSPQFAMNVVSFDNLPETNIKVKMTSDDRLYIANIVFYDGYYQENDFDSYMGITPSFGKSKMIENISGNSYIFNDLPSQKYKYRVRAAINQAVSRWSDYQYVELNDVNGITDSFLSLPTTSYFSINGKSFLNERMLKRDIYIVRNKDGVKKFIKK